MAENSYLGHRSRMRKKVLQNSEALLDYELLEVLLFNIFARKDTKSIAKDMIKNCGGLSNVFFSDYHKLQSIENVSDSTISMIFTIRSIMRRILHEEIKNESSLLPENQDSESNEVNATLSDNFKIINYLKMTIGNNQKESLCTLYLDTRMKLIAADTEEYGTIDRIGIYHREIIKRALDLHAAGIVISHNHPSGDPKPSKADIQLTDQLNKICVNMGIKLLDHVIISEKRHYSFYKDGLL